MTGWFGYKCGKGVLLVPTPRCLPPGSKCGGSANTAATGFAGDIGADSKGSIVSARRAGALSAMSSEAAAEAVGIIAGLKDEGKITAAYAAAATNAALRKPELVTARTVTGESRTQFGASLAPKALAGDLTPFKGLAVGADPRKSCACEPTPCHRVDPITSWCLYFVNGGVLMTTHLRCGMGSGSPPGWATSTFRNTLRLFKSPPTAGGMPETPPALKGLEALAARIDSSFGAPATPCTPDEILGRDLGAFGSGWWFVKRGGQKMMVPNPKTCP